MRIPRLLALIVGKEYLEGELEELEARHAAARARLHAEVLGKVCLKYPGEDAAKLSKIIELAEDELLAPFEEHYREQRRDLRAAIAACG
jgi:hypothetical protein